MNVRVVSTDDGPPTTNELDDGPPDTNDEPDSPDPLDEPPLVVVTVLVEITWDDESSSAPNRPACWNDAPDAPADDPLAYWSIWEYLN